MTDDSADTVSDLALPVAGLVAAGAALYVIARRGSMDGPVTGSGAAVANRYPISNQDAHGMYARIWLGVQGYSLDTPPWTDTTRPAPDPFAGAPQMTIEHLRFFDAWRLSEGGKATWNPFNTTWRTGNIKTYNSAGVGQYATQLDGELATAKTIRLKYYKDLVARLTDPNATAEYIAASPNLVTWRRGFKPDDGHPYVTGILKRYPKQAGGTGIPYRYPVYGV